MMLVRVLKCGIFALLCSGLLVSQHAYGFLKTSVGIGFGQKARLSFEDKTLADYNPELTSSHYTLSVLASPFPIPLVDIGVGLAGGLDTYNFSQVSYELDDDDTDTAKFESIRAYVIGPKLSVAASIPGVPISPRARAHYAFTFQRLYGTYDADGEAKEFRIPLQGRGPRLGAGVEISPFPLVAIIIEYEWAYEKVSLTKELVSQVENAVNKTKFFQNVNADNFKNSGYSMIRRGFVIGAQIGF